MMKKTLIQEYLKNAKNNGQKIAVIDGSKKKSNNELYEDIYKIASSLIEMGIKQNSVVACFLDKSIDSVESNLGISLATAAYMNLDIKAPIERLQSVINNVEPSAIVTNLKNIDKCKSITNSNIKILLIEELLKQNSDKVNEINYRLNKVIDTDLYCIINTSGSTGVPKSVALGHRSFLDFCDWTFSEYDAEQLKCIGSLSPVIFDIYSFELAMLCVNGSCLVLIPEIYAPFPIKILEIVNQNNVSFIFWVPTIMVNIANMNLLSEVTLDTLKICWFAGEVFPTKQFNYWRNSLPKVQFSNLYGPIEITLDCTFYKINRILKDEEPIPIGFACDNTNILILNNNDNLCGKEEEGELCVRGSSLAFGYYNNIEKTKSVFIQNPLNKKYPEIIYKTGDIVFENNMGEIIFKGRKDTLIKHLGYRIELTEIEHCIVNKLSQVSNCCALYNAIKKEIVVFLECDSINGFDEAKFRKELANYLPKYMIPTKILVVAELPRNTNGKIDRNKLAESLNNE
jgi:amino acid adenylation domain-containing protein